MRALLLLLVFLAVPVSARASPQGSQTLTFEKVIDGATIVASGRNIGLWGVKALDPTDANSFAANLYLETMLKKGQLRCDPVSSYGDRQVMHCYSDGADIGSLMVQMGMARAGDPYYASEEGYAQEQHRGVWSPKPGTPL